jgi:hypothetical protein
MLSVKEILELEEEGTITVAEMHARLARLIGTENIDDLMQSLPTGIRSEFVKWLREQFSNDEHDNEFFPIGGEGCEPLPESTIPAIRLWLNQNPKI